MPERAASACWLITVSSCISDQQAQLEDNLPAAIIGNLRANVQVVHLIETIQEMVSSDGPLDRGRRGFSCKNSGKILTSMAGTIS